MKFVVLGVVLCVCGSAQAQFKCVDAKGNVAFQQTPCAASDKEQKIRVYGGSAAAPPARAASEPAQPTLNADQRMLANIERERRLEAKGQTIDTLERQIGYLEAVIDRRNAQMLAELDTLKAKKRYANNNLAGATWEQSISAEMQAITQKYKTMNDVDFERMRQLRADLESTKAAK